MNDWDLFFRWLNPEPEPAASEYKSLRQALIEYFQKRECPDPESLADRTIERVVGLLTKFGDDLPTNPLRYCYGVAKYIHKEYFSRELRRNGGQAPDTQPDFYDSSQAADQETLDLCLSNCLGKLPPQKCDAFTRYYLVDSTSKGAIRQSLADELGVTINALRLQMLRLKEELRNCITICRQRTPLI